MQKNYTPIPGSDKDILTKIQNVFQGDPERFRAYKADPEIDPRIAQGMITRIKNILGIPPG